MKAVVALAAVVLLALPAAAQARPATASKDGRPNILVVMTDDQAAADVAGMPNVKRLLEAQGTTFADAIDSFPLCCPARALSTSKTPSTPRANAASCYPEKGRLITSSCSSC